VFVSVIVVLALYRVGEGDDVAGADYRFKAASVGSQPSAPTVKVPAQTALEPVAQKPMTTRQVEESLQRWAESWSARRADDHLKWFDSGFPNRDAYFKNRSARIAAAKLIEVRIESPTFKELGNNEISVQFIHHYRSDTFKSRDRKELVWRLTVDGPKIVSERNLPI